MPGPHLHYKYISPRFSGGATDEGKHVKNFWYLFAAYSTIWTALCVYMMRLSQKNKELQAELRDLQAQLERVLTK